MRSKNIILLLIFVLLLGIVIYKYTRTPPNTKKTYKIGLIYLLQHPAIDQGIQGFKDELNKIELQTGVKFDVTYSNAFGEPKNVNGIIAGFKQNKCDLIVALTTPCAQIAKQLVTDRPVIFVGISDPINAGLVKSLDSGFNNITGTTSKDPNFETLELSTKLFPSVRKVGVVFTSSESNSISILSNLEKMIKNKNLNVEIVKKSITNTIEILPVTKSLLSQVDALFLINDNTVISSVDLLIKESRSQKKPIFASDIESVNKGALFTFGLNYRDEGVASADILQQILIDKKRPSEIPVYVNSKYYLFANREIYQYSIDTNLIRSAEIVGK